MGARGLGIFDHWYCTGLVVGLLRAWLGRLVVLGSGRECLVYALACRLSIAAFISSH